MPTLKPEPLPRYVEKIPDKYKYINSSGLPFDKHTQQNIDQLRNRVELDLASCIVIDGAMGKGKTTLAVQLADYIQRDFIDLDGQLSLGGKEFFKKADAVVSHKKKVLIYDEAGDFDRRGALGKFNAMLNRFFQTYRAFKIIVIVIVPNFKVLDNRLFDNQVPRCLFHLTTKGLTYAEYKAYSLKRMFWILSGFKKYNDPLTAYKLAEPNFKGNVKDLPPERRALLDKISTAGKKEIVQESRVKLENLVNRKDISRAFNKNLWWVSSRLAINDIKPVQKLGRAELYEQGVIAQIRQGEKARAEALK